MGDTAKTIPDAFENLKMFGFQNGETNPFMGEISNKMIIGTALNNILVQNADVESELDAAQKQMEEIIN
jgi:multiple sugar transport system substrate-binding protein